MKNLKAADAKEVASSCTAIANEKLKAEKEANASKKKGGTVHILFRSSLKKFLTESFLGGRVSSLFLFLYVELS